MADECEGSNSPSSFHCYSVEGSVKLCACNSAVGSQSTLCRDAVLSVGRNADRRIVLHISLRSKPPLSYLLNHVKIHSQLAKEGKGTIQIPSKNLQILLSNCPPKRLRVFLKTLEAKIKLDSLRSNQRTPLRNRNNAPLSSAFADLPEMMDKLSPLSINEILKLRPEMGKSPRANPMKSPGLTPKARKATTGAIRRPTSAILLTAEQKSVVRLVESGASIFFTGPAGTGKSLVLREIIGRLRPEWTAVTAATGVAACGIGGTTLHSFAGIGTGEEGWESTSKLALRPKTSAAWRRCRHLVIDEISMVHGSFFTLLERVARFVRGNEQPFGGIQLILCGDFLQLPPVVRPGQTRQFAFQSPVWDKCVKHSIGLQRIHRQAEPEFAAMLNELRLGLCSQSTIEKLKATAKNSCAKSDEGIESTRLCTHKAQAININCRAIANLTGKLVELRAVDGGSITSDMEAILPPKSIQLKVGAQVMLTKNVDLSKGLSNGARGVVVGFGGESGRTPRVRWSDGDETLVGSVKTEIRLAASTESVWRIQVPLELAWAISIHKAQGMSLHRLEVSLSTAFEEGQAYVALSRATSLQGLRVLDFHPSIIAANKQVLHFYRMLDSHRSSPSLHHSPPPLKRQRLSSHFD